MNIKGSQGFKELPKNIPCDIAHIWDGAGGAEKTQQHRTVNKAFGE